MRSIQTLCAFETYRFGGLLKSWRHIVVFSHTSCIKTVENWVSVLRETFKTAIDYYIPQIMPSPKVDSGFVKAESRNLPKICSRTLGSTGTGEKSFSGVLIVELWQSSTKHHLQGGFFDISKNFRLRQWIFTTLWRHEYHRRHSVISGTFPEHLKSVLFKR